MRYLVVGAGALGGYFGGRLIEAGMRRHLPAAAGGRAALQRTGLVIKSRFGDLALPAPRHVLADGIAATYDVVIVACKAYDLAETMASFAPAVGAAHGDPAAPERHAPPRRPEARASAPSACSAACA